MSLRLRDNVEIHAAEGEFVLRDRLTGASFTLEGEFAFLLDPAKAAGVPASSWSALSDLALVEQGLSEDQVRSKQGNARRDLHRQEQEERLLATVSHCMTRVPYYRERPNQYRLLRNASELTELPLLHKPALRRHSTNALLTEGFDLSSALAARQVELASTSGTTGERLQVAVNLELPAVPMQYAEIWGLPESEETPKTAVLTGPLCSGTECHLGRLPMEGRIRAGSTLVLNSADDLFSMRRDLVENIAEELERFRPDLLLVNPFYLHWMARLARGYGITLPKVQLVLSSYQYLSELQRRALEQLTGAPVRNFYAATDLGGSKLGIECHRGRLHAREDQSFLEVVPEGLGMLAVTALESRVMPLLRYVVGDLARWTQEQCDCAVGHWSTFELHGRNKDRIWLDGQWRTTREVDRVVSEVQGVGFYKCVQEGETLRFEIVAAVDADPINSELERELGQRLSASSVQVKRVQRLDPEPSLKFRLTQSRTHVPPELM